MQLSTRGLLEKKDLLQDKPNEKPQEKEKEVIPKTEEVTKN